MHVADRVEEVADATASIACVGLDPRPDLVPPSIAASALARHGDTAEAVASAFIELNTAIIDAIAGHCVAVKPQAACYEAYGAPGWSALVETVHHARRAGLVVVVDAKRGDIASTATHYRQAFFGGAATLAGGSVSAMAAEWVTVNPWLGSDNVLEMAADPPGQHGLFVLVKTSNPSGGEIQDLAVGEGTVAGNVARLVHSLGSARIGRSGLSDIGAIVGATYPGEAKVLRAAMPNALFLVPGYGAQGARAEAALAGIRDDGSGVLVSSSRSVIGAWKDEGAPDAWVDAARNALDEMNGALNSHR